MTPTKEKCIAALLTSRTKREAAQKAGVSERTLRTYFEDDEFLRQYRQAFSHMVQDAARSAQQLISPALSTLQDIMEDVNETGGTRIQAARSVLEYAIKLTAQLDILERIEKQEREELFYGL